MRQARSRYRLLAIRVSCRSQLTFSATAEERASMWKKSTPVLDVVLDQHPLGVAADEVGGGPGQLVGQQQGRILVPQLGDGQLAEGALVIVQLDPPVQDAWGLVRAGDALPLDPS